MNTVEILSGIGVKGPACLRLTVGGKRLILECGFGPDADAPFDPAWLEGAEAVFITHDHIDHIGGAAYVIAAGLPIYTTRQTAQALPPGADVREIPEQGTVEIGGVRLTTGRNGHALGGVWLHFDLGNGLFYSGDWSEESQWFRFDEPPQAATAVIDCSYHLDPVCQSDRLAALDQLMAELPGQILLPVPPSGRAGELALHLMRRHGADQVRLDPTCRDVLARSLQSGGVTDQAQEIAPLLAHDDLSSARFLICDSPNADAGAAKAIVCAWQDSGRLGRNAHVIFTGHVTPSARPILEGPGGHFQRWNVHPPLPDQIGLIHRIGAKRFAPAFCTDPKAYLRVPAFQAEVFLNEEIEL